MAFRIRLRSLPLHFMKRWHHVWRRRIGCKDSTRVDDEEVGGLALTPSSNYNVFAHLSAEKCVMYRTVLNVFVQAKARFVIHLRPTDVERHLADGGVRYADGTAVEIMLQQLMAWGNLEAHPDTAEVLTVDDFWRVRNLYQMSPAGGAAAAALAGVRQSPPPPSEFHGAALRQQRQTPPPGLLLSHHG